MHSATFRPIQLLVPVELFNRLRMAADATGRPLEELVLDAVTERVDPDYEQTRIVLSDDGFDALLHQIEQPMPPESYDALRRLLHGDGSDEGTSS